MRKESDFFGKWTKLSPHFSQCRSSACLTSDLNVLYNMCLVKYLCWINKNINQNRKMNKSLQNALISELQLLYCSYWEFTCYTSIQGLINSGSPKGGRNEPIFFWFAITFFLMSIFKNLKSKSKNILFQKQTIKDKQ